MISVLVFLPNLPPSVPSVPQDVSATSTGSTNVLMTWMEPAAFFREHMHNCGIVFACVDDIQYYS